MTWTTASAQPAPADHNQPMWTNPVDASVSRDALIMQWNASKELLQLSKDTEMNLRKKVAELLFPTPDVGTQRYDLGNGYKVKLVHKLTYTLNPETTQDALDKMDKFGKTEAERAQSELLADRLVKFVPQISTKEYKELPAGLKEIIDEVLTITPGVPTLEIEAPKVK